MVIILSTLKQNVCLECLDVAPAEATVDGRGRDVNFADFHSLRHNPKICSEGLGEHPEYVFHNYENRREGEWAKNVPLPLALMDASVGSNAFALTRCNTLLFCYIRNPMGF